MYNGSLDLDKGSGVLAYLCAFNESQLQRKKDIARSEVGLRPSGATLTTDE